MKTLTASSTAGANTGGRPDPAISTAVVIEPATATAIAGPSEATQAVIITAANNNANGTWTKNASHNQMVTVAATRKIPSARAYHVSPARETACGASARVRLEDDPA